VNAVGDWVLIYGHWGAPAMGAVGSGWSTTFSRIYMALGLAGATLQHDRRARTGLARTRLAPDFARIRRLLRLGFPAALQMLAEVAVFAAATLSSLAPPAAALAQLGATLATVGPGKVASVVHQDGYTLKALVSPNTPAAPNSFGLEISKNGQPVTNADVTITFEMLDMQMGSEEYQLSETRPGVYTHSAPALVMAGRWGLLYSVTPKQGHAFTALLVDKAGG